MRKLAAILMFVAMASPAFAEDGFVKREADRSGTTGTMNMVGNSIQGFFSHLGSTMGSFGKHHEAKSGTKSEAKSS